MTLHTAIKNISSNKFKNWIVIIIVLLTANNTRTFIHFYELNLIDLRTSLPQTFNSTNHDWVWAEQHFKDANISISSVDIRNLPSTQELLALLGDSPLFLAGEENGQCSRFQGLVSEENRWIGVSGLFNSGTNLLSALLTANCEMPGKEKHDRVLWQVPWGKHEFANTSRNRTAPGYTSIDKNKGLTVVVTKNPYEWTKSMCRNPYIVQWNTKRKYCPDLSSTVTAWKTHQNIIHFWNDWHSMYLNENVFPYPKVIIRYEDLVTRPKETISSICNCAGGKLKAPFRYIAESSKIGTGHNSKTGMFEAWSKLLLSTEARAGLSVDDFRIAKESLDSDLMTLFKFSHPPGE